jgi:hypothetical protein
VSTQLTWVNFLLQVTYKLSIFCGWYWPHLNIWWLIFSISYPFKGAWASYVCLFWFDSSLAPWVDVEWDSSSTESSPSETPRWLSQRRVRLHVNWFNAEGTNIYEDFIICVDSVDVESHSALTQLTGNETQRQLSHCRMLKNLNKSANSSTKSKTLKSLITWPIYGWSVKKTGSRKSHASVPLTSEVPA